MFLFVLWASYVSLEVYTNNSTQYKYIIFIYEYIVWNPLLYETMPILQHNQ